MLGPAAKPAKAVRVYPLLAVYVPVLFLFYWKYVPLVIGLQVVLLPILALTCALTAFRLRQGTFLFLFLFPLINTLPYFFGLYEDTPQAPTALVLFLFYALGLLLNNRAALARWDEARANPLFRPLSVFALIVVVSAAISVLRYSNFFPFVSSGLYELKVNVNGVRAGGAIMSVVLSSLNYLTGILFFWCALSLAGRAEAGRKLRAVFSLSFLFVLLFGMVQRYAAPGWGATPFWRSLQQLNATLKDPNAFGVVLAATIPLFLGQALSSRRTYSRGSFAALLLLSLWMLPAIGSRSAVLGLLAALVCFFLLSRAGSGSSNRRTLLWTAVILLAVAGAIILTVLLYPGSTLARRLSSSFAWLERRGTVDAFFNLRLLFWRAALAMLAAHPLTGVGVGSYIIELPNSLERMGMPHGATDSALNHVFQVGSELGIIGLAALLWAAAALVRELRRRWRRISPDDPDRFIFVGSVSGLASFGVNFLFQTHIGSFDAKYVFWFFAAISLAAPRNGGAEGPSPTAVQKTGVRFRIAAVLTLVLYGAVLSLHSLRSLSIRSMTEEFSVRQDFGFYDWEQDDDGRAFRWTKKTAGFAVDNFGPGLAVPVLASHPDLEQKPVLLRVFLAGAEFKKERLLREVRFTRKRWEDLVFRAGEIPLGRVHLVLESSRTWRPGMLLGVPDPRALGVAVGRERSLDPE